MSQDERVFDTHGLRASIDEDEEYMEEVVEDDDGVEEVIIDVDGPRFERAGSILLRAMPSGTSKQQFSYVDISGHGDVQFVEGDLAEEEFYEEEVLSDEEIEEEIIEEDDYYEEEVLEEEESPVQVPVTAVSKEQPDLLPADDDSDDEDPPEKEEVLEAIQYIIKQEKPIDKGELGPEHLLMLETLPLEDLTEIMKHFELCDNSRSPIRWDLVIMLIISGNDEYEENEEDKDDAGAPPFCIPCNEPAAQEAVLGPTAAVGK
jgi:hypothetical protein